MQEDGGREPHPKRIGLRAIPKHISIEDLNGKDHIDVPQKSAVSNPLLNGDISSQ
jgi:hypothetical protein